MFRELRRKHNQMSEADTIALLERGTEGVLGTISENGYPYTVVVNYVYLNHKIYFHSATEGHKIDNINTNEKVSFTVYDSVKVVEDKFTTKYKSATLFGKAKVIGVSKEILMALLEKYSPDFLKEGKMYVDRAFQTTHLVEIEIEHLTGKERL